MFKFLSKYNYLVGFIVILFAWELCSFFQIIPAYLLPSPSSIIVTTVHDLPLLAYHGLYTLLEAFIGLFLSIFIGFFIAIWMDQSPAVHRFFYPFLVVTQTVPTVAIAPLLVLWLGYGLAPKIFLVFLTCFFPIINGIYTGLQSVDPDKIALLKSMGATKRQIFWHAKWPAALPFFFASLKTATSYAIVGSVVAEWLGGDRGLGVYMTRARQSFAFDRLFAVIFIIVILTQLLIKLIDQCEKHILHWKQIPNKELL